MSHVPSDFEWDDDEDFYSDYEESSDEPVGSCDNDQCEEDLFGDDWYIVRGMRLCSRCAWIASGCPEPKRRKP